MLAWKAVSLAVVLALLPMSLAAGQGVQWQDDLQQAMAAAKESKRLVLVHFWKESCGPCVALDKRVFNQPTVAMAIQHQYVPVKVNTNDSPGVARAYGVTELPTDVVLTPEGQVVRQLSCPETPMEYMSQLRDVANAVARQPGDKYFQPVSAESPYGPAVNNAYSNLQLPPGPAASGPLASQPAAPGAATGRTPQNQPSAQRGGYAAAPSVQANPYASGAQQPAAPPLTAQAPPHQGRSVASAPTGSNAATGESPDEFPGLPPGVPPLGFDGYCTVTMKHELRWAKGDVKWGAVHRGRTYLFAGEEQRDEFLKNPDTYSPVLSGMDPVVALEENRATPGKRMFALEYLGQFYMFSSEDSMNRFWTNPEGYAQGVRQAMATGERSTVR